MDSKSMRDARKGGNMITTIKQAEKHAGTLSAGNGKMPCYTTSLPACKCKTGAKLKTIKGTVCFNCYADKGNYLFPSVQAGLTRRFEALSDPLWVESMAFMINKREYGRYFRWFDSGDIQSENHIENINQVCMATPTVSHWLPTREIRTLLNWLESGAEIAPNLCIRVSAPKISQCLPKPLKQKLQNIGLTFSIVIDPTKTNQSDLGKYFQCVAPNQNGQCRDCRKCWDKSNNTTGYILH